MTEILPDVHQLKIPITDNPLKYTNSYLVKGDNEYLIIDPGMNTDESFDALKSGLATIGIGIESITRILATHSHGDHYGLADTLKQLSQARILLHEKDINPFNLEELGMDELRRRIGEWLYSNGLTADELPQLQIGPPSGMRRPASTSPDIILHGGEIINCGVFNFQVIWTPGHSPGHVCLYEPIHKILFSGDHILPIITPSIQLFPESMANPLGDFLNSLDRVKQLDVNLVLPAHEHIFTNLQTRVEEIIQHHEQRNSEILSTIKTGPKTAYQISTGITWIPERGGIGFHDLTQWDRRMALAETLAHLETIRANGKVEKFYKDSIIYYQLT